MISVHRIDVLRAPDGDRFGHDLAPATMEVVETLRREGQRAGTHGGNELSGRRREGKRPDCLRRRGGRSDRRARRWRRRGSRAGGRGEKAWATAARTNSPVGRWRGRRRAAATGRGRGVCGRFPLRGRERGERRVMESRERSEERNATFLSVRQYFSASMSRSSGQRVKHVERTKSAMPGSKALLLGISGKLK